MFYTVLLGVFVAAVAFSVRQQRRTVRHYEEAQKLVLDRQLESLTLQREAVDVQRETNRLLQVIAGHRES